MKSHQSNLEWVIGVNATIIVVYLVGVFLELPVGVLWALLSTAWVATVWMALRILKDPYSTDKTFDQQFYQDRDDIRRNGTE